LSQKFSVSWGVADIIEAGLTADMGVAPRSQCAFQSRLGISPTGELDMRTLDALELPDQNMAYLESAPSSYGSRVRVHTKSKHGKWKAKWKKHHKDYDGDEYGDDDDGGNGNGGRHGHDD
jgi:hypothetical protein